MQGLPRRPKNGNFAKFVKIAELGNAAKIAETQIVRLLKTFKIWVIPKN